MAERKRVVTRKKSADKVSAGKFNFDSSMIPVMSNGKPEADFLTKYRKEAWKIFESKELPQTYEEPWRRTDIKKLAADSFRLPKDDAKFQSVPDEYLSPIDGSEDGGKIIITPTGVDVSLSAEISDQGVIFTDLETAAVKHPKILKKVLGKLVKSDEDKFSALTAALSEKGVLLYVPKGVKIAKPLHSVLWGPGTGLAYLSHVLIYLEDNSGALYIHESASPTEKKQTMHSGIVEVHVGQGASLTFVEIQSWGEHVWNFTHERACIEKDAHLEWVIGSLGSKLSKNFTEIDLIGEGAVGRVSGLYFTDKNQHLDHDTQQNHNAANTSSDLLFKGVLKDKSRSVWQGMIYVAPGAQKTDGYQKNPNLVLSDDARADSIPGLEIMADDVRCTHGATVGQIDPSEVFYLNSRGIPTEDAEKLIVEGFFEAVIQRVPFESLRLRLQRAIIDKLE